MGAMVERYSLSSLDEVTGLFGTGRRARAAVQHRAALAAAPIRDRGGPLARALGLLAALARPRGKRGPHVPHAPIDELDATPLLRNAFTRQRCLVLADGFFVWRRAGKEAAADVAAPRARSGATARPLRA